MLKVDLSDLNRVHRRAERQLGRTAPTMLAIAKRGAQQIRDGDTYQDRTGNLRAATKAFILRDDSSVRIVVLGMFQLYASFVERRGFSIINRVGPRVARNILRRFIRDAERLDNA